MRRLLYLALLSLLGVVILAPTAGAQDATGTQGLMSLLIVALINAGAGFLGGVTSAYMINNRSLLSEAEAEEAGASTSHRSRLASYLTRVAPYRGR